VTGGGRGVGRATALALARRGAAVAVLARTAAEVEATAAVITAAGGRALALPTGIEDAARAVVATEAALGPVDVLINNAAVVTPVAPLWRTEPADWLACLTTNLYGPYLAARAVLPGMLRRGWGRVVNVSSGAARGAVYGGGAYCSAKAGLDHLTRVLALELVGSGVTANVVYPGGVDTAMQARLREVSAADFGADNVEHFRRAKAEGKLLDPAIPAALITWVVVEGGAEANGETFSINDVAVRQRAGIGS
jgi:NAD(P)-dependent dehydrogenase (short-subunit alcohol dehydrogenase family)